MSTTNAVPGEMPGWEGLKAFVTYLRTAFPDIHFTIEDLIAAEDKCAGHDAAVGCDSHANVKLQHLSAVLAG